MGSHHPSQTRLGHLTRGTASPHQGYRTAYPHFTLPPHGVRTHPPRGPGLNILNPPQTPHPPHPGTLTLTVRGPTSLSTAQPNVVGPHIARTLTLTLTLKTTRGNRPCHHTPNTVRTHARMTYFSCARSNMLMSALPGPLPGYQTRSPGHHIKELMSAQPRITTSSNLYG